MEIVSRKTALSCGSVGKIKKEGKMLAAGIRIRDEANCPVLKKVYRKE